MLLALLDNFMWRALLGGLGVAVLAGPMGCFVVWRRMAYFGDALAHGALLGVALGFALEVDLNLSTLLTFLGFTLVLTALQGQSRLATDTLLGILSHSALALGLVALSFMARLRVDLLGFLFGDILAVTRMDLVWIYGGGVLVLTVTTLLWSPLVAITVHEELARAEGVAVWPLRMALMLLIALVMAVAMKLIGVLLITSLLIIPAATARSFARSPEEMAVLATLVGCLAVLLGLGASVAWDTPSGPSVIVAAVVLFVLSLAYADAWRRWAMSRQRA